MCFGKKDNKHDISREMRERDKIKNECDSVVIKSRGRYANTVVGNGTRGSGLPVENARKN